MAELFGKKDSLLLAMALVAAIAVVSLTSMAVEAAIPPMLQAKINLVNAGGPYLGVVIPNTFEMNPLLSHPSYQPSLIFPYIDFAGRRFRVGMLENKKVILVMTGLSMINAGITTQLLLALFRIEGVVHYGIAGNANPDLHIGDVSIPQYWAHTGLWSWQRYGYGPDDLLPLEAFGDYTRDIGYFKFSDYDTSNEAGSDNLLNNVWFQPEEIFPVDGTPESRQHAFYVPVDKNYLAVAKTLEGLKLASCINATTCLPTEPRVVAEGYGASASVFLDNAAYRDFIHNLTHVSPVDMESASVALICLQQRVPFIAIRALSDLAGGGSSESNESDLFEPLAAQNSITAAVEFVKRLRNVHGPLVSAV